MSMCVKAEACMQPLGLTTIVLSGFLVQSALCLSALTFSTGMSPIVKSPECTPVLCHCKVACTNNTLLLIFGCKVGFRPLCLVQRNSSLLKDVCFKEHYLVLLSVLLSTTGCKRILWGKSTVVCVCPWRNNLHFLKGSGCQVLFTSQGLMQSYLQLLLCICIPVLAFIYCCDRLCHQKEIC